MLGTGIPSAKRNGFLTGDTFRSLGICLYCLKVRFGVVWVRPIGGSSFLWKICRRDSRGVHFGKFRDMEYIFWCSNDDDGESCESVEAGSLEEAFSKFGCPVPGHPVFTAEGVNPFYKGKKYNRVMPNSVFQGKEVVWEKKKRYQGGY